MVDMLNHWIIISETCSVKTSMHLIKRGILFVLTGSSMAGFLDPMYGDAEPEEDKSKHGGEWLSTGGFLLAPQVVIH
jgi:hypothetical protein